MNLEHVRRDIDVTLYQDFPAQSLAGVPSASSLDRIAACKPDLTVAQILAWADDHKRRMGRWPRHSSGRVKPPDETWLAINMALTRGNCGLPGGSSLAKVLDRHRGVRNLKDGLASPKARSHIYSASIIRR
jgi:hypothetical protein